MGRWGRWEGSEVARWERWEGNEVARLERWENGEAERWEVPVLFKDGEHKMSPRFHLFVSDVNQENAGVGCVQDFLPGRRDGKTLLRSFAS